MKKLTILLIVLLLTTYSLFSTDISFHGGTSKVIMKENNKMVTLSNKAEVKTGSLVIKADSITIEGNNYDKITCNGNITIEDEKNGFVIKTDSLYYNRTTDKIIISSYCEISDTKNELEASANNLTYDLAADNLILQIDVHLVKASNEEIMSCAAEQMKYDRKEQMLALLGGALVYFKQDTYNANAIIVNLDTEEITLEGKIKGTING
ncbi:MAG: hypothetical protein GX903_09750 [Spirochaetales bacterium]|nr:hypothetical protein [Spirochaetales bacterium]